MNSIEILMEAITLRKCVCATYNKDKLILAPHVLYTQHDEYFVDALAVERNGAAPKQFKIGIFKVTGLKSLIIDEKSFQPMRKFESAREKFTGTIIATV